MKVRFGIALAVLMMCQSGAFAKEHFYEPDSTIRDCDYKLRPESLKRMSLNLEKLPLPEGDKFIAYYEQDPLRFPEITT